MCCLQKFFPKPRIHSFSPLFSSKSFIVLHSSLNIFQVNFCVWWGNKCRSSCFADAHPVVNSVSFPHWIMLHFHQKTHVDLFLDSIFYTTVFYFYTNTILSCLLELYTRTLKSGSLNPSTLVFFFKTVLTKLNFCKNDC